MLYLNPLRCGFGKRKYLRQIFGVLFMFSIVIQFLPIKISPVHAESNMLMVFAEAASFARLDDADPTGWFYQAVLYNPTNTTIVVDGLRWRYNATAKMIEASRNARCYDKRYFTALPVTTFLSDRAIYWEYAAGSISITVSPKKIAVTWIEVPARSINDETVNTFYYVEAHVGTQWLSSPTYPSHSGQDNAATTLFRADFNLTTSPSIENQTHPNPQWLYNEDRYVVANMSSRVRLIPVAASRNSLGIGTATINITLPANWHYVLGSAYNPYGETITPYTVAGKDKLQWELIIPITRYATNQSMAQNYIEFNITAPYTPGIYNFSVNARITSLSAKTTTENQNIYVVVRTSPTAIFASSPKPALTLQNVSFNASASYDPDGQVANYFWEFGDGGNATGEITTHPYAEDGNYTVELTIIDDEGLKATVLGVVTILNRSPIAQFTESAETVLTGTNIHFNASGSYDMDGTITSYFWNFGDQTNTTGMTADHTYQDDGNYIVTLTVTDNDGAKTSANATKTAQNRPPIASFTESAEIVDTHEIIYLNASMSYDLDGSVVSYFWDFGDGINATGKMANHYYTDNGTYIVTLTVTDDDSATATTNSIKTVNNRLPMVVFSKSTETAYVAQTITFNASDSYDYDGTISVYFWDFGDGTNSTGIAVNHAYADNGNHTITLTVTDDDGATASVNATMIILNWAPAASFSSSPLQPAVGVSMVFNASGSYDPDGTLMNYTWNFGDGNITTTSESTITHVYSQSANFNVTLTVIDNDGQSALTWQLVFAHIRDVAIVNVTLSQVEVQIGGIITISVTVKNEGTLTESFSVSVFCNDTEIATQQVHDLPSGTEHLLVFYWNTSSVSDAARFAIQARASKVLYEMDIVDNDYADEYVSVIETRGNGFSIGPLPDWSWLLFAIPPLALLVVGITWKKRNAGAKFKGIEYLDKITDGPIPEGFSVLVSGEAGSGKSVLCQELTYRHLDMGKSCVYATYDCFPDEIRSNMQKFHAHLSEHETEGRFTFIDCYSSIAKVESKEKYFLNQPFSLSDLGITLSKVTTEVDAPLRVFLDSIVPLLTHVESQKVAEFLQDRSARIKGVDGTFIFTVGKETIDLSLLSRLEEVVDCVIELDVNASKGKKIRRLRVKKMRGRKPWEKWVSFRIDPAKGIVFLA